MENKVIDWQPVLDSGLDCEFYRNASHFKKIDLLAIGPLRRIVCGNINSAGSGEPVHGDMFWTRNDQRYSGCRIRHNQKFGWSGGEGFGLDGIESPLPEGVLICYNGRYRPRRDGESLFFAGSGGPNKIDWSRFEGWFAVKGLEDGYTWQ